MAPFGFPERSERAFERGELRAAQGSAGTEGPRAAHASRGIWKWGIPTNHGFDPRPRQVTVTYEARCLVERSLRAVVLRFSPSGSLIRHRAPTPKPAHFEKPVRLPMGRALFHPAVKTILRTSAEGRRK